MAHIKDLIFTLPSEEESEPTTLFEDHDSSSDGYEEERSSSEEPEEKTPPPSSSEVKEDGALSGELRCFNCSTKNTPLWRRGASGEYLCNACGLYWKIHSAHRPLSLKTDVIKPRNRSKKNESPVPRKNAAAGIRKQKKGSKVPKVEKQAWSPASSSSSSSTPSSSLLDDDTQFEIGDCVIIRPDGDEGSPLFGVIKGFIKKKSLFRFSYLNPKRKAPTHAPEECKVTDFSMGKREPSAFPTSRIEGLLNFSLYSRKRQDSPPPSDDSAESPSSADEMEADLGTPQTPDTPPLPPAHELRVLPFPTFSPFPNHHLNLEEMAAFALCGLGQ